MLILQLMNHINIELRLQMFRSVLFQKFNYTLYSSPSVVHALKQMNSEIFHLVCIYFTCAMVNWLSNYLLMSINIRVFL